MKKIIIILLLLILSVETCFAATFQYIISGSSDSPIATGGTEYQLLMGSGDVAWNATETSRQSVIPTAGTLTDFQVGVRTAPGAGKSWTFTVRSGNPIGNSALSVSIAEMDVISVLDTSLVSVVAGDLVSVSSVGISTPTAVGAVWWTCKFIPDTAGETILLAGQTSWITELNYKPLIGNKTSPDATLFDGQTLFPTSGTLKNFYCELVTAPGAGTDRTFKIEKNGVDSSIAITISGTNTTGNDTTNTLTVAAGDRVAIQETAVTGTPATTRDKWGIVFVPDTQGEWFTSATTDDTLSTAATEYQQLTCGDSTLTTTENEQYVLAQATTAKAIYVALSTDPGTAPDAYTFTLRRNGATDTALTVTITADNTTGSLVTDVTISANDLLSTSIVPVSTPAATPASQIAYLFYDAPTGAFSQAMLID